MCSYINIVMTIFFPLLLIIETEQLPVLVPPSECVCAWMVTQLNLSYITAPDGYESCWLWGLISLCGLGWSVYLTWQVCYCFWMLASCGLRRCSRWVRFSLSSPNPVEENAAFTRETETAALLSLLVPADINSPCHVNEELLVSSRGSSKVVYIPTCLCYIYFAQKAA